MGAALNLGKRLFFTGHLDTLRTRCPILALAECTKGVSRRAIRKMSKVKAAPILINWYAFIFKG
jgi:hypothetical protein